MWRPAGAAVAAMAVAGLSLSAAVLYARESRYPAPPPTERLLYLRSGQVADRLTLSFDALAADVYWIRTIQHYGRDLMAARRGRPRLDSYALLQPLLDLTTTLDPHFNIAYRFGAIFLAMEPPLGPGRADQAIALLEKGLAVSPDRWQYAYDIGFVHYFRTGDFDEAARWFRRASEMPGAPEWIAPFVAVTLVEGGRRQQAEEMLRQLLQSPERYIRDAATRGLLQIRALDAIDQLTAIVEAFAAERGTYPRAWSEIPMFAAGPPADETGTPFVYDPGTHEVSLGAESPLAPLPRALQR